MRNFSRDLIENLAVPLAATAVIAVASPAMAAMDDFLGAWNNVDHGSRVLPAFRSDAMGRSLGSMCGRNAIPLTVTGEKQRCSPS